MSCNHLFMKTSQCVFVPLFLLPNSGLYPIASSTSFNVTCSSFHLKINVPYGFSTLMHSVKPCLTSNGQVSFNFPYFLANHELSPARTKCGGSNTTKWNELSSNAKSLKSITTSGLTFNTRPSHNVPLNCRLSMYNTSS